MADVILTLRIMPESPEIDLKTLESKVKKKITAFSGESQMKLEQQPVAFGLKALMVTFVMDENKGSTEELEKDIESLEEVQSVEVTDVRRAVG